MMRNKKATIEQEMYLMVFELILVVLIGVALFQYVDKISEDLTFHKKFLSRDLSFVMQAIEGSPGDISYYYPADTTKYDLFISILGPQISLYEDLRAPRTTYRFGHDDALGQIVYAAPIKTPLTVFKGPNSIRINEEVNLKQLYVPDAPTETDQVNIVLVPIAATAGDDILNEILLKMKDMADSLHEDDRIKGKIHIANSNNDPKIADASALVVAFDIRWSLESDENPVKIHYSLRSSSSNVLKSQRLAKEMGNAFIDANELDLLTIRDDGSATANTEFTIKSISGHDIDYFISRNQQHILAQDRVGIIIEFGGLENFDYSSATIKLGELLFESLKEYYKMGKAVETIPCVESFCKEDCLAFGGNDEAKVCEKGVCCLDSAPKCERTYKENYGLDEEKYYCRPKERCDEVTEGMKPSEMSQYQDSNPDMCLAGKACCKLK